MFYFRYAGECFFKIVSLSADLFFNNMMSKHISALNKNRVR